MNRVATLAFAAAIVAALAAAGATAASPRPLVFLQTNNPRGNQIVVYDRAQHGHLTRGGTYATGGDGGVAAPGTESDHLASQGSLV